MQTLKHRRAVSTLRVRAFVLAVLLIVTSFLFLAPPASAHDDGYVDQSWWQNSWQQNNYGNGYSNSYCDDHHFTVRTSRWVIVNNYGKLTATDDWGYQFTVRSSEYDEWCVSDYFFVIRKGSNIYYKYRSGDLWTLLVSNAEPGISINGMNVYYHVRNYYPRHLDYERYNDYYDQYRCD